jgi:hypothetical protein
MRTAFTLALVTLAFALVAFLLVGPRSAAITAALTLVQAAEAQLLD